MDKSKPNRAKIISLDMDSLWIEALVQGTDGVSLADPITFQASSIDHVRGLGSKASLIRLNSGTDVIVRLPHAELMQRLRDADGSVLDLKDVSYTEGKAKLITQMQSDFKKAVEDARFAPLENLAFRAWVRAPNATDFREISFSGQDVHMREISEGDSIMGGKNIRLQMKDPRKAPFDGAEFIMEGNLAQFRMMCHDAHARGQKELDLREYTARKGLKPPKPGPKP